MLLEDDLILGETLDEELCEHGFDVTWIKDAHSAANITFDQSFDLYLLDVNVPGQSGFDLLQALRESGDETPSIFLTSRSSVKDLQEGFDAGADDYITKPFDMDVLLICIHAKIKTKQKLFISEDAYLNLQNGLLYINSNIVDLPKRELEILEYYLTHKERTIGKDEILEILYEGDFISDATFRVYIRNLNKHLQGHANLRNVRGVGYRFE